MNEQCFTYAQLRKCALLVNPHTNSTEYRARDHGMDAKTYAEALRGQSLEAAP